MNKAIIAFLLIALVFCTVGCQTPSRDSEQSIQQYSRIAEINRRMLAEDMEAFWLLDRPSRLSRWNMRDK
ncbi:MAG: hypothetical protein JW936_02150 [Sedimentisphaerales bacterium]|nr:hypothetical protein [Sedimentisphaerales bacterium]